MKLQHSSSRQVNNTLRISTRAGLDVKVYQIKPCLLIARCYTIQVVFFYRANSAASISICAPLCVLCEARRAVEKALRPELRVVKLIHSSQARAWDDGLQRLGLVLRSVVKAVVAQGFVEAGSRWPVCVSCSYRSIFLNGITGIFSQHSHTSPVLCRYFTLITQCQIYSEHGKCHMPCSFHRRPSSFISEVMRMSPR